MVFAIRLRGDVQGVSPSNANGSEGIIHRRSSSQKNRLTVVSSRPELKGSPPPPQSTLVSMEEKRNRWEKKEGEFDCLPNRGYFIL